MKQGQIIKAYKAINNLAAQPLPLREAYALHKLRAALRPTWDFQQQEEEKEIRRLEPQFEQNGDLLFKSPDDAAAFRAKLKELEENDVEMEYEPAKVRMADGAVLSMNDIEALGGFVEFTEG